MNIRLKKYISIFISAISLLSISCEKEKGGIIDPSILPPYVRSLNLSTDYLHLDTSTTSITRLPNGTFTITVTIEAVIGDPSGLQNIDDASFSVYAPSEDSPFRSGHLSRSTVLSGNTEAIYQATVSFNIHRTETGLYKVEVYTTNHSMLLSNSMEVSLRITKNNSLPHLSNLNAPDTVIRPNVGYFNTVFLAVSVRDSDGLGDIQEVFFRSLNSTDPSYHFPLLDDGNVNPSNEDILTKPVVSGDSVAGDGRYARIIPVFSTFQPGNRLFRFYVVDKSGTIGDSLDHTIVFKAPE